MFYFPFHIWDVILPFDELHHFSRWFFNHQPVMLSLCDQTPFLWRSLEGMDKNPKNSPKLNLVVGPEPGESIEYSIPIPIS